MANKNLYKSKRYWYHVSTTLNRKKHNLKPRSEGFNRPGNEPVKSRICVAPTMEQCIAAIPYCLSDNVSIYRTEEKIVAGKPYDVFDSNITDEGWIFNPTVFIKIGNINFEKIEKKNNGKSVIPEAASSGEVRYSGKVLRWWIRMKIDRFLEY